MTTPDTAPEKIQLEAAPENDERKRRTLLLVLMLLLLLVCCVGYFIVSYLIKPQPVAQMVPVINNIVYPPSYKASINDVDRPIGVTGSQDGQRIYVAEAGGKRWIKMFDREGTLLKSFGPPRSTENSRSPSYMAVDAAGRLFVADANGTIDIYDAEGNYIDGIIGKDMTISKFLAGKVSGGLPAGAAVAYDGVTNIASYKTSGGDWQNVPGEQITDFAPVGLRFNQQGDLLVTDITDKTHSVIVIPAAALNGSLVNYNPVIKQFGVEGKEPGQLLFPNSAVTDSKGNYYVSDSNNGRISVWKPDLQYSTFFGFGSAESGLNLPHGIWMDKKDHLHVVDVVGQVIRVYDVSGAEPAFIYNFGDFGVTEGLFNFPNDIFIDGTGRLYIADRENNRIQVWSY